MLGVGQACAIGFVVGELLAQSMVFPCDPCSISDRILGFRIGLALTVVVFGGQLEEFFVDGPGLEDEFRYRGMPVQFLQVQIESLTSAVLLLEGVWCLSVVSFDVVLLL